MKHLIKILITSLLTACFSLCAYATDLPVPITDLVKKTFPKVSIRFDGLIELPDGTQYLPVLPYSYANTPNPAE